MANCDLQKLAIDLGAILQARKMMIATAESCTGGLLAASITAIPNSSLYFERGFITYSNASKIETLGVEAKTIAIHGAVSRETVSSMAQGAVQKSHAQVSIAITGIAGPAGGSEEKPVGTVFFGFCLPKNIIHIAYQHFLGEREKIRNKAVTFAIKELITILKKS